MLIIPAIVMSSCVLADVLIEDILPDTAIAVLSVQNADELSGKLEAIGVADAACEFTQYMMDETDTKHTGWLGSKREIKHMNEEYDKNKVKTK